MSDNRNLEQALSQLALRQLWVMLAELSFKLSKKADRETTIRAYPFKHGQYPLLNPRFEPTAAWLDEAWDKPCLDLAVCSKGARASLDRELSKFHSSNDCVFIAEPCTASRGYYQHGHFLIALNFVGKELDFIALKQPLAKLLNFLQAIATMSVNHE